MSDFIMSLSDTSAGLSQLRGKGTSLARLATAGLPVPDGFHVTPATYNQFVAANHLGAEITAALADIAPTQPASIEAAARGIWAAFETGQMSDAIAAEIGAAYASLGEQAVAVRSSVTAEDLPKLSFADQQETYLNVQGVPVVLDAVQCCWGSLWTPRAIGYRLQHGIDQRVVRPAVVVHRLVSAGAADPNRRSDFYDSRQKEVVTVTAIIKGFAGAAGCVEGIVRRIDRVEDGNQIQPGEILVTTPTNVGWTPLFLHLAAIVTEVGARLSHAAIVARKLDIPAVDGCGNVNMLLKTGDRVRMDGSVGMVELK